MTDKEKERLEEWTAYRSKMKMFPQSELLNVINMEDTVLPVGEGYVFTSIIDNVEEMKKFILKFASLEAFVEGEWIEIVGDENEDEGYYDSLYVNDELKDEQFILVPDKVEKNVLVHNPFFEGEEVQLHLQEIETYKDRQIVLTSQATDLDFPVFMRVSILESFDRTGNVSIKEIEVHSLGSYGNHKIQCL